MISGNVTLYFNDGRWISKSICSSLVGLQLNGKRPCRYKLFIDKQSIDMSNIIDVHKLNNWVNGDLSNAIARR